jgi:hypothetical protein
MKKMSTRFECIQCIVKAAMESAGLCFLDPAQREEAAREVLLRLSGEDFTKTPVEVSHRLMSYIREKSGVFDPHIEIKRERNKRARAMIGEVKSTIARHGNDLQAYVKAAAAGNIMDKVAGNDNLFFASLQDVFKKGFALNHWDRFQAQLEKAHNILYIADNTGEIFIDALLVQELVKLGKKITFCVRGAPAVDDALEEDWLAAGLDRHTTLVTTGTGHLGCVMEEVSPAFREAFARADMIIAKGMGNFETLAHLEDPRVFLVLKAKCSCVADALGVAEGDFCLAGQALHHTSGFRP